MERITAKQAAEKWGVSDRAVQNLCAQGRIPGAERWGRSWMIPAGAEKPRDGRARQPQQGPAPRILLPKQTPLVMMSDLYRSPGDAPACVEQLSTSPETAALAQGWLALYRGEWSRALALTAPLLQVEADFYGSLSVGMLTTACALWNNDAALWHRGRSQLAGVFCADESQRLLRDFWLGVTDAGVLTNIQHLSWYSWSEFGKLPSDSLPAVWFYYARHMHKIALNMARGKSEFPDIQGLGLFRLYPYLAEPLIAQVRHSGALLAEICIRLLCADAYINIGMRDVGLRHLDLALDYALADGLYGVLAEFRNQQNTILDERLERLDREAARAVKRLHKTMAASWTEMTKRPVALNLSARQSEIARLAALGLSNDEIAQRLSVSFQTVKSTVSMIMNKTGATRRSEFSDYIF